MCVSVCSVWVCMWRGGGGGGGGGGGEGKWVCSNISSYTVVTRLGYPVQSKMTTCLAESYLPSLEHGTTMTCSCGLGHKL